MSAGLDLYLTIVGFITLFGLPVYILSLKYINYVNLNFYLKHVLIYIMSISFSILIISIIINFVKL